MGIFNEFKTFISRGNVVDLAVGVIIGAAFGKIVSSLVADVILPPIGVLVGGVDFTDLAYTIKAAETDGSGKILKEAVQLKYGNFIQTIFDFLITAFAVFIVIKAMNKMKKAEAAAPPAPAPPTKEETLLTEIRDLLKK